MKQSNKKIRLENKNSLWLLRVLMIVLLVFIFINRPEVVARYNESAFWGLLSMTIFIWLVFEWALWRIKASGRIRYFMVMVGATALYADSFGTMAHFYDDHYWYDRPMHFFGTAAITFWLWYIVRVLLLERNIRLPLDWHAWLVFVTAVFIGNIFEYFEYTMDLLFVDGHYWIAPAPDTVEDILFNALGAGTVVLVMWWISAKLKNKNQDF